MSMYSHDTDTQTLFVGCVAVFTQIDQKKPRCRCCQCNISNLCCQSPLFGGKNRSLCVMFNYKPL